tara:strand:+ start:775 stop:1380 length:606 start_codon:yes stop_codon:yes gene_type:complete
MKINDQNLKLKLCEAYFSILNDTNKNSINLQELCLKINVPFDKVKTLIPEKSVNSIFFLKILINKLDKEALEEFKFDISEDTISSTYDKILEGLTVRFEKILVYKPALQILSNTQESKVENFFKLFHENYFFMFNLVGLVENKQNCIIKTLKSFVLNGLFTKSIEVFLKDENKSLDRTIRYLDQNLKDIEDVGIFTGIIKR